jgi:hypothetical protein
LNLRLENGAEGEALLAWLNGLADVQTMLRDDFGGVDISKQNLSEWRLGGFREWQLREEWKAQARAISDATGEMDGVLDASLLARDLAVALAARYAALLNGWDGEPDPKFEEKLRLLRGLNRDIALLQRTMQRASEQKREVEREFEESLKRDLAEKKQRTLNMLWSEPKTQALAELLGNGALGRRLAEVIMAIQDDLPVPERKEEGKGKKEERGRGRGRSNGSKGSKTDGGGQTESNPVVFGRANAVI